MTRFSLLNLDKAPEPEREHSWILQSRLEDLDRYVRQFEAALNLFDISREQRRSEALGVQSGHWMFIAARDGAMTIYHFANTLQYIRSLLRSCPTIKALVNAPSLRKTTELFQTQFPHVKTMRHALAHSAELSRSPKHFKKNSFKGDYEGFGVSIKHSSVMMKDNLQDRNYVNTFNGEIVSYEVSSTTLNHLNAAKNSFYSSFGQIDA